MQLFKLTHETLLIYLRQYAHRPKSNNYIFDRYHVYCVVSYLRL